MANKRPVFLVYFIIISVQIFGTNFIWQVYCVLLLKIFFRPNAVALADSFDLHDETVASALGGYNGNAYQALYESTQYEPMNQTEVCM